jgi:hypothetical protein
VVAATLPPSAEPRTIAPSSQSLATMPPEQRSTIVDDLAPLRPLPVFSELPISELRIAMDPIPGGLGLPSLPASPFPSIGPSVPPDSSAPGSQIAVRLGELAKDALLVGDNASLERWVDGLSAAGESPAYIERMRAMARLGRGDIGDALRVLRRTRSKLDPADHRRRCQTSLALGVALSVAGRSQDALLEGMDALARARQVGDERGAKACLAFLAKLYTSVSREDDAERLRQRSL